MPLLIAVGITAIVLAAWFRFADGLLQEVWSCHTGIGPERPVWYGRLKCMSASELGDVLAGFFAPAAFLVLVVTVLLQGLELKAQRQELSETRDVFIAQNALITAQTDAAVKSANLMERQNQILLAQEEARLAELAKRRFESTMRRLETLIRTRICEQHLFVDPSNDETHQLIGLMPSALPADTFAAIGAAIQRALAVHTVRATTNTPGLPSRLILLDRYGARSALLHALNLTVQAMEDAQQLGESEKGVVKEMSLAGFAWLLRFYTTDPAERPDEVMIA